MTLAQVVSDLDSFPEEHTIYLAANAKQWEASSPALVTEPPEDGKIEQVFDGVPMWYFLEVSLAREAIEVYQEHHHTLTPTDEEKLKAVIYFAEYDAYLPPPGGWQ